MLKCHSYLFKFGPPQKAMKRIKYMIYAKYIESYMENKKRFAWNCNYPSWMYTTLTISQENFTFLKMEGITYRCELNNMCLIGSIASNLQLDYRFEVY